MPGTVVTSHFRVLTDAEEFCDRQIERVLELWEGELYHLHHDVDSKTFRLTFNSPTIGDHEVTYAVDNLHEFDPDTNWGCF